MPFNGSGSFSPPGADYPAVANTLIEATKRNNIDSDFATGLSTCITKDGQTTVTANIPFAGFKLTGVGAATSRTDATQYAQVQKSAPQLVGTIAGTNTITGVLTPTLTAYTSGQTFRFIPANTNTGATTINIDALGAKNIFWNNAACVGGEIRASVPVEVMYDGTQFQITGNASFFNSAGAIARTAAGEVTLPLQPSFLAEALAGTDVTGDGTIVNPQIFATEVYDRNADYNAATGVFTAPVTGLYDFGAQLALAQLAAGHTGGYLRIQTSNRTYEGFYGNFGALRDASNEFRFAWSVVAADMDAADTASVTWMVSGATKVVDLAVTVSKFSGALRA
jgi:hypothetical protein